MIDAMRMINTETLLVLCLNFSTHCPATQGWPCFNISCRIFWYTIQNTFNWEWIHIFPEIIPECFYNTCLHSGCFTKSNNMTLQYFCTAKFWVSWVSKKTPKIKHQNENTTSYTRTFSKNYVMGFYYLIRDLGGEYKALSDGYRRVE